MKIGADGRAVVVPRHWHCHLVMKRAEVPLIAGRLKVVDKCRNCGWQQTEIYSRTGQLLVWKNDSLPVSTVAAQTQPGV